MRKLLSFAALVAFCVSGGAWAGLVIDDFSTPFALQDGRILICPVKPDNSTQLAECQDPAVDPLPYTQVTPAGAIGDRTVNIEPLPNSAGVVTYASRLFIFTDGTPPVDDLLLWSNDTLSQSRFQLGYNFPETDFTANGGDRLVVVSVAFDRDERNSAAEVEDADGNISRVVASGPVSSDTPFLEVPFSDFSAVTPAPADFSRLVRLSFQVESNTDGEDLVVALIFVPSIEKTLESGPAQVPIYGDVATTWDFRISYQNGPRDFDVVVRDSVPEELEITALAPGVGGASSSDGDIEWTIPAATDCSATCILDVTVQTALIPEDGGRYQPTECGPFMLNSGATAYDPEDTVVLGPSNSLEVEAVDGGEPCGGGTGTPGYWKNHPEAWPVDSIEIGGVSYSREEAIALMESPTARDKTFNMFEQLVATKLNLLNGTTGSCIVDTVTEADAWMASYPVGSNVRANSDAWRDSGSSLHGTLDDYNNGLLCAPSRD